MLFQFQFMMVELVSTKGCTDCWHMQCHYLIGLSGISSKLPSWQYLQQLFLRSWAFNFIALNSFIHRFPWADIQLENSLGLSCTTLTEFCSDVNCNNWNLLKAFKFIYWAILFDGIISICAMFCTAFVLLRSKCWHS